MERKKRLAYLHIQKHLIYTEYTYKQYWKEYTNASQQLEIYSYCSMNKQYVKGVQKPKIYIV